MTEAGVIDEYPYRTRWRSALLVTGFFGLCAAFSSYKAVANSRRIAGDRVFGLGPSEVPVFFWVLAGVSAAFVVAGFGMAVHRVVWPRRIAFTNEGLIVPVGSFSRQERVIPFDSIRELTVAKQGDLYFIKLEHTGGRYTINGLLLASDADVFKVAERIVEGCPQLSASDPKG